MKNTNVISKEQWDKLTYKQQEYHLQRCYNCQMKFAPFDLIKYFDDDYLLGFKYICEMCYDEENQND